MRLHVAWIQAKPGKDKSREIAALTTHYLKRIGHFASVETHELPDEAALFKQREKPTGTRVLVVLDARGKQMSSEELADWLGSHQSRGTQHLMFAIGGADGFTPEACKAADVQLSLGKMTLPHELARVVLLEQLYRAFTILKGHPYHKGH